MKIHVVLHESFEAPGAIEAWARKKNHALTYTRLYQYEGFPDVDKFDCLIVMGGPQSPATTTVECPYFDAKKEIAFVRDAIAAGKFTLGVCLGAQLIGEALGAGFGHSPNKEIGVFELSLTAAGKADPMLAGFPEQFMVGHWHGDMPGLTPSSAVLASSAGCPRQIVRYGARAYGFQCHFEFTKDVIEGMVANGSSELEENKGLPFVQDAGALTKSDFSEMNGLLFKFLDRVAI